MPDMQDRTLSQAALGALAALLVFAGSPALAHDVPDRLRECTEETDDSKRLACFDREVATMIERAEEPEEPVRATVTRVIDRSDGTWVVHLDNGDIWAQKSREYAPVKVGDQVTLKGGAFSSMYLTTEGKRSTQVKRLR